MILYVVLLTENSTLPAGDAVKTMQTRPKEVRRTLLDGLPVFFKDQVYDTACSAEDTASDTPGSRMRSIPRLIPMRGSRWDG
jgi:hypothetical protein